MGAMGRHRGSGGGRARRFARVGRGWASARPSAVGGRFDLESVADPSARAAFPRAFVRDMLRCWARGWKRFVSIMTITLLGVAVLTGIYAGCRDMFRAADRFYAAQGLHDIQVMSSYGLTDDDVQALRAVKGVETVQPERSQSVTAKVGGSDKTVTLVEIGVAGLDMPYVQDGRMPSKAGEIAVTKKFLMDSGMRIGDSLTVEPVSQSSSAPQSQIGLEEDGSGLDAGITEDGSPVAGESGSAGSAVGAAAGSADSGSGADDSGIDGEQAPSFPTDLTIVGEVLDPKDLSNPDGIGTAAFRQNIAADYTFFAPSDGVTGNVYTAVSLTVNGTAGLSAFSGDYDAAVGEVADRIERTVLSERQQSRRQTIVNAAQAKLDQAKKDAHAKLDDAQRTIDDQKKQLADGRQQAKDAKTTLEDQQVELDNNAERLAEGRDQLNAGLTQARNGQSQLQQGLATAQTMSEIAGPAADAAEQSAASAEQAVRDAERSAVPVPAETLATLRDSRQSPRRRHPTARQGQRRGRAGRRPQRPTRAGQRHHRPTRTAIGTARSAIRTDPSGTPADPRRTQTDRSHRRPA